MNYLSLPQFILHTEFRIDNPSSFREKAIKVQMLTHYNEQKIIQRCMILKCLLHFMVHATYVDEPEIKCFILKKNALLHSRSSIRFSRLYIDIVMCYYRKYLYFLIVYI